VEGRQRPLQRENKQNVDTVDEEFVVKTTPGRLRRRKGEGYNRDIPEWSNIPILSDKKVGQEWSIKHLPKNPCAVTHPGFWYRNSSSWTGVRNEKSRLYNLPCITNLGFISNCTVYKWNCKPSQIVATLVSTVYHRLMKLMKRRHKHKAFKLSHQVLRCAVYYVFTKNDYFLNRVLGITRVTPWKSKSRLRKLLSLVEAKLDENTRFVLRQVCFQADWLKFRAERPRDKSNIRFVPSCYRDLSNKIDRYHMLHHSLRGDILRHVARCATVFWMRPTPKNYSNLNIQVWISLESEFTTGNEVSFF